MKLSVRLFDQEERDYLAKMLELASKRARIAVSHSNAAQADVIFLCAEEPGAHALLNDRSQKRIVVVYGGSPDSHGWALPRPATSQNLIPLLERLFNTLSNAAQQEADNDSGSTMLFPSRHGNHLLERLIQLNSEGQPWQCSLEGGASFIADPQNRRLHYSAELASQPGLLPLIAVRQSNPQISRLDSGELTSLAASMHSMSLEAFCWQVACTAEPQVPSELALLDRRFRLKRWPSFSQLKHTPAQISITGRLMRESMSVRELVGDGRISLEEVVQFFNCASTCGLTELDDLAPRPQPKVTSPLTEEPRQQPAEAPANKRRLFNRILRTLGSLSNVARTA